MTSSRHLSQHFAWFISGSSLTTLIVAASLLALPPNRLEAADNNSRGAQGATVQSTEAAAAKANETKAPASTAASQMQQFSNQSKADELRAKQQKLEAENKAIDSAMKEAQEKADKAMSAAWTGMVIGIATGLTQIGAAAAGTPAAQGQAQQQQGQSGLVASIAALVSRRDGIARDIDRELGKKAGSADNAQKQQLDTLNEMRGRRDQLDKQILGQVTSLRNSNGDALALVQAVLKSTYEQQQKDLKSLAEEVRKHNQDRSQLAAAAKAFADNRAAENERNMLQLTATAQRVRAAEALAVKTELGILSAQRDDLAKRIVQVSAGGQKGRANDQQTQSRDLQRQAERLDEAIKSRTGELRKIKDAERDAAQSQLKRTEDMLNQAKRDMAEHQAASKKGKAEDRADAQSQMQQLKGLQDALNGQASAQKKALSQLAAEQSEMAKREALQKKVAEGLRGNPGKLDQLIIPKDSGKGGAQAGGGGGVSSYAGLTAGALAGQKGGARDPADAAVDKALKQIQDKVAEKKAGGTTERQLGDIMKGQNNQGAGQAAAETLRLAQGTAQQGQAQGKAQVLSGIQQLVAQRDDLARTLVNQLASTGDAQAKKQDALARESELKTKRGQLDQLDKQILDQLATIRKSSQAEAQTAQERMKSLQEQSHTQQQVRAEKAREAREDNDSRALLGTIFGGLLIGTVVGKEIAGAADNVQRAKGTEAQALKTEIGILAAQHDEKTREVSRLQAEIQKSKGSKADELKAEMAALVGQRNKLNESIGSQTAELRKVREAEHAAAQGQLKQISSMQDAIKRETADREAASKKGNAADRAEAQSQMQQLKGLQDALNGSASAQKKALSQIAAEQSEMARREATQKKIAEALRANPGKLDQLIIAKDSGKGGVSSYAGLTAGALAGGKGGNPANEAVEKALKNIQDKAAEKEKANSQMDAANRTMTRGTAGGTATPAAIAAAQAAIGGQNQSQSGSRPHGIAALIATYEAASKAANDALRHKTEQADKQLKEKESLSHQLDKLTEMKGRREQVGKQVLEELAGIRKSSREEAQAAAQEKMKSLQQQTEELKRLAEKNADRSTAKTMALFFGDDPGRSSETLKQAANEQRARATEGAAMKAEIAILAAQHDDTTREISRLQAEMQKKAKGSKADELKAEMAALIGQRNKLNESIGSQTAELRKVKEAEHAAAQGQAQQLTRLQQAFNQRLSEQQDAAKKSGKTAEAMKEMQQTKDLRDAFNGSVSAQNKALSQIAAEQSEIAKREAMQKKIAEGLRANPGKLDQLIIAKGASVVTHAGLGAGALAGQKGSEKDAADTALANTLKKIQDKVAATKAAEDTKGGTASRINELLKDQNKASAAKAADQLRAAQDKKEQAASSVAGSDKKSGLSSKLEQQNKLNERQAGGGSDKKSGLSSKLEQQNKLNERQAGGGSDKKSGLSSKMEQQNKLDERQAGGGSDKKSGLSSKLEQQNKLNERQAGSGSDKKSGLSSKLEQQNKINERQGGKAADQLKRMEEAGKQQQRMDQLKAKQQAIAAPCPNPPCNATLQRATSGSTSAMDRLGGGPSSAPILAGTKAAVGAKAKAIGDQSQEKQMRLQNAADQKNKSMEAISNMQKKQSETSGAMMKNMR